MACSLPCRWLATNVIMKQQGCSSKQVPESMRGAACLATHCRRQQPRWAQRNLKTSYATLLHLGQMFLLMVAYIIMHWKRPAETIGLTIQIWSSYYLSLVLRRPISAVHYTPQHQVALPR